MRSSLYWPRLSTLPVRRSVLRCRAYSSSATAAESPQEEEDNLEKRVTYVDHAPRMGDTIYVAMSGGVDSSLAASLYKQAGHNVMGIFMRNWTTDDDPSRTAQGCPQERDWQDVQAVCAHLRIPCRRVDLSKNYWHDVFEPALEGYREGKTPNPDVSCNREIKFGKFFDHVAQLAAAEGPLGANQKWWLATGHYARAAHRLELTTSFASLDPPKESVLMRSKGDKKDQTYYLSQIPQRALRHALFPLSAYPKSHVRKLALSHGLPTAQKPDSQGLCFVEPTNHGKHFRNFLSQYLEPNPGPIKTDSGVVVGTHQGLWHATVGEGSGVSTPQMTPGFRGRWYVLKKDQEKNEITIVNGTDHPLLYHRSLIAHKFKWITEAERVPLLGKEIALEAQIKHGPYAQECGIQVLSDGPEGSEVRILFRNRQRGIAPGQHVAVWRGDICLGGGAIKCAEEDETHTSYRGY
ncbi:hypothetical protein YB2330_005067 [Saitoella coloradoensis]